MLRMISLPSALRKVWKPRLFTKRLHQPGRAGTGFDDASG
jgi:hypothetical protein